MPLIPQTLSAQILAAMQKAKANATPQAEHDFANDLAVAIDTYIKSGDVQTTVVGVVAGTAVTGTGTGKLA